MTNHFIMLRFIIFLITIGVGFAGCGHISLEIPSVFKTKAVDQQSEKSQPVEEKRVAAKMEEQNNSEKDPHLSASKDSENEKNAETGAFRWNGKPFLLHRIKKGETLSKVAKEYYGDCRKFNIIAEYNKLTDSDLIYLGQKIKIPNEKILDLKSKKTRYKEPKKEEAKVQDVKVQGDKEISQQRSTAHRDSGVQLYKEGKYETAIIELNKALNIDPEDPLSRQYSGRSHFKKAMGFFEEEEYLAARHHFKVCTGYNENRSKCLWYMKEAERQYKETHYNRGMRLFQREELHEATAEWELVRLIDPQYKRVDYLIKKAELMIKKIEALKKNRRTNMSRNIVLEY